MPPPALSARDAARTRHGGLLTDGSMRRMRGVGSVVTVTTRLRAATLERMARSRLARDGAAQLAAETSNGRQRRLLQQVRENLAADAGLDVFCADRTDGYSYVTVRRAGERRCGIIGEPNGTSDPDDYFG